MKKEFKSKKIPKKALIITACVILVLAAGLFALYRVMNPRKILRSEPVRLVCPIPHIGKLKNHIVACDRCRADAILAYMYDTNATGRVFTDNWGLERFTLPEKYTHIRKFEKYLCGSLNTLERDDYPSRLLLGLDPYAIFLQSCSNEVTYRKNIEFICDLADNNPYTLIYVYLPEDSAERWNSLSGKELSDARLAYIQMVRIFTEFPNIWVYYHSSDEWVLFSESIRSGTANGAIREDVIDHYMVSDIADLDTTYMLNQANVNEVINDVITLSEKYDETRLSYADLSEKKVVFLGDSVIGNYRNETSIPAFFADMTGAETYNLGIGGISGTGINDPSTTLGTAFAFITGNTSLDEFDKKCRGMASYNSFRLVGNDIRGTDGSGYIFVIEYGLNDYFSGLPVNEFSDSMTDAVRYIKNAYPEARILMLSPGYVGAFNNGTTINSDEGSVLSEYRTAVEEIANSCHCDLLSLTDDFGFTQDEIYSYLLADAVHYSEIGRYRIAQVMARYYKK